MPRIDNVHILQTMVPGSSRVSLFQMPPAVTAFEQRDLSNIPVVMPHVAASSAEQTAFFRSEILPMEHARSSRRKLWSSWKVVLTWALAYDEFHSLLPMSLATLQAMSTHLIAFNSSAAQVKEVWNSIIARHRAAGLISPLAAPGAYARMYRTVAKLTGTQQRIKVPVTADILKSVLDLAYNTMVDERDRLAVAVAVVCAMRPAEIRQLQVCDLRFDADVAVSNHVFYKGTLSINISSCKQDQARKGHHPRVGKAKQPKYDIVARLKEHIRVAGLAQSISCTKSANPSARCPYCPPLFPATIQCAGRTMCTSTAPPTGWFTQAMQKCITQIGLGKIHFSGKSARKGGISSALDEGVPEALLYLQSGHSLPTSGRTYMQISRIRLLYAMWESFQL